MSTLNAARVGTLTTLPSTVDAHFPPHVPFVRYGTHGDGTCFFHSVCAARNISGYLTASRQQQRNIGRQYRREFTSHVTPEVWSQLSGATTTAEQAIRNFRDTKLWADQDMIQFVARILRLNLLFLDADASRLYCGVHGEPDEPMIIILWVGRAHFEPVGAYRASREGETGVQFVFHPKQDAKIVDHMLNSYKGQCAA
jgi:hypothetical protein